MQVEALQFLSNGRPIPAPELSAGRSSFEKVDGQDIDSDGFASAQTITAMTVPGTGVPATTSVAITNGANIDSIAGGDEFRMRVTRDTANDTLANTAQLLGVELTETRPRAGGPRRRSARSSVE
jgi:hypothetical protein